MTDSLTIAVSELKSKIMEHVAALQQNEDWCEIQRLYSGLGVLESICKLPKTELAQLLGIGSEDALKIEKYEFAGLLPLDAAKQYLRKIAPKQKAASLDDIIAALERGNLKVNKDDLRISLSRSTLEIYKAGDDIYGLVESYPHIKRGTPGRKKAAAGATGNDAKDSVIADTDTKGEPKP